MPIRVLLVEDSPVALVVLQKILARSPHIEVVGTAKSGVEALAIIPQIKPDVVCTDLHMPHMDGLTLTTEIMDRFPLPILIVSISSQTRDTEQAFHLLAAGAVDVFPKPVAGLTEDNQTLNQALIDKIRVLAGVRVFRKRAKHNAPPPKIAAQQTATHTATRRAATTRKPTLTAGASAALQPVPGSRFSRKRPKLLVIGASTGGPVAMQTILRQLPPTFLPVICVQHIGMGFLQGLIDWLQKTCVLSLKIAQPGEFPRSGYVYFPPEDCHLALDPRGRFIHLDSPPVEGHRPAITTTLMSAAQRYGSGAMGVLLTGMGRDGAVGLSAMAQAGCFTVAQDEASSVVFGMPKEAIALGAATQVLPVTEIAPALLEFVKHFPGASL